MALDRWHLLKTLRIGGVVFLLLLIVFRFYHAVNTNDVSNAELYSSVFPKFLFHSFLWLRQKINFALAKILPEPQLSLMKSLFFGGKNNLPYDLKQQIRRVGLSHLVAVSGLHLTIVSQIISSILNACLIGGIFNFFISLLFILGFVVMADFSSSVIRASIMAIILLLSKLFHRVYRSSYALILAVLIMVSLKPQILADDFSFQLSVLATLGIIYVYPLFQKNNQLNFLKESFLLSISALIFVWPWIVYKTQMFSLVAPLSNLLVVPLIPVIMIMGFFVAGAAFIFFPLAFWGGFCLNILLSYVLKVITFLSRWPLAEVFWPQINWFFILVYYLVLIYIIYHYHKKYYGG